MIHFAVQKKLTQHCKATILPTKLKKKTQKIVMSILIHKEKKQNKQKTKITLTINKAFPSCDLQLLLLRARLNLKKKVSQCKQK